MVKVVFNTHYYEWEGVIYKQTEGGTIGVRATGPIARILMDYWAEEIRKMTDRTQTLHAINPVMFEDMRLHMPKNMLMIVLFH